MKSMKIAVSQARADRTQAVMELNLLLKGLCWILVGKVSIYSCDCMRGNQVHISLLCIVYPLP